MFFVQDSLQQMHYSGSFQMVEAFVASCLLSSSDLVVDALPNHPIFTHYELCAEGVI